MSVNIFSDTGGLSTTTTNAKHAFITFTSPANIKDILITTAPITGVIVEQRVDYNITKAFDRDFLIAAFGDQPVSIILKGLNIYNSACPGLADPNKQIVSFYNENKLSVDLKRRVDVGIYGAGHANAFRCALVSLSVTADQATADSGLYGYRLDMIGVAL